MAESPSESSGADSQQSAAAEEEASDDTQKVSRTKKRICRDRKADKAVVKRQKALVAQDDSNDSMAEAENDFALVISDSEARADDESDKENQLTKQTRCRSTMWTTGAYHAGKRMMCLAMHPLCKAWHVVSCTKHLTMSETYQQMIPLVLSHSSTSTKAKAGIVYHLC